MQFAGVALGLVVLAASCQPDETRTDDGDEAVLVTYAYGGGMDRYQDGDRYGHRLTVRFDGTYTLYERIYREENGERSIRDQNIAQDTLEEEPLESLKTQVQAFAAEAWPERLPDVDPRRVELREPADQVTLEARAEPGDEPTTVRAHMGADPEHYPGAFWTLHQELRRLTHDAGDAAR